MVSGKVQNVTVQNVTLVFKKDGESESFRLKDLFKSSIGSMIYGGVKMDAFYCEDCKKIAMMTNCI